MSQLLNTDPELHVGGIAHDGVAALQLTKKLTPDLVIMDRQLPSLDGIQTTRLIRQSHPTIKVLGLAADLAPAVITEWIQAGASACMLKCKTIEEIRFAIHAVMRGELIIDRAAADVMFQGYAFPDKSDRARLSPREVDVLKLIATGRSTKQAARDLQISTKTIETHRRNMMDKLNVENVADLTRFVIHEGISPL